MDRNVTRSQNAAGFVTPKQAVEVFHSSSALFQPLNITSDFRAVLNLMRDAACRTGQPRPDQGHCTGGIDE